jgi:hypothetical protein
MNRRLVICASLGLLAVIAWPSDRILQAQQKTVEIASVCQLISQPDKYRGNSVTLRVRVSTYRHGTSISDQACPKQSLLLVADQSAVQADSVSHFYQFLAEHRRSSEPILATITGRLVKGSEGGFLLKRDVVFELESVSEISEGYHPKSQ